MAGVVESREWHLAAYAPEGVPTSDHLKLRTVTLSLDVDSIPDHHLIVQNIFISVDPYQRTLMSGLADGLYFPQTKLNEVVSATTIARVIRSKDSSYREGDIVLNPFGPIAEYCVIPSALHLRKVDPASELPLQEFLSSLGLPGFAAWVGIEVLGDPKPGSNVFVSAAAGGVGMFAGQLAKLKGCRVIGSTGSDEKVLVWLGFHGVVVYWAVFGWFGSLGCDVVGDSVVVVWLVVVEVVVWLWNGWWFVVKWVFGCGYGSLWVFCGCGFGCLALGMSVFYGCEKVKLIKEEFGYDDAFNYKTETDLDAALSKYFPNGIDIYFDNVGGEMLEAVLNHVNRHARIPVCGMISQYKKIWTERQGVRNLLNMVGKEVRMEGFLVGSHLNRFGDFAKEMESYIKEGKISSKLKIYHGIESYLESLGSLFTSSNFGKVIIEVKK
uniref:Uncharacterized protein n=1 Tax=Quercus lobata TaxID=97700 RepID=A0A7N2MCA8_QUELO